MQITTRSKLSSVSWNHYVKSQLITSDYGGLIQVCGRPGRLACVPFARRRGCTAGMHWVRVWCLPGLPAHSFPVLPSPAPAATQLWDASTAGEAAQFDEHARRVWSVDFSTTDPMRFLRFVRWNVMHHWLCSRWPLSNLTLAALLPPSSGWGNQYT